MSTQSIVIALLLTYLFTACAGPEIASTTGLVFDTIPLINDSLLIREVENGIVTKEYREINGNKEGSFKKFDVNGKLQSWGNYVNDQKTGRWQRADSLDSLYFFVTVFEEGRQIGYGNRYLYWKPPHPTRFWNITNTENDTINRRWGYYESGQLAAYNFSNKNSGLDSIIGFRKNGDTSDFSISLKGKLQYMNLYDD